MLRASAPFLSVSSSRTTIINCSIASFAMFALPCRHRLPAKEPCHEAIMHVSERVRNMKVRTRSMHIVASWTAGAVGGGARGIGACVEWARAEVAAGMPHHGGGLL